MPRVPVGQVVDPDVREFSTSIDGNEQFGETRDQATSSPFAAFQVQAR
jgi:hypothetical protein